MQHRRRLPRLGITTVDLSGENGRRPAGPPKARRVVATYPYTDATGNLLFEVLRYDPKSFCQRRPGGKGGWTYNLAGVQRVLYRLPQVLAAVRAGEAVFLAEGEKDADALARLGLVATTNPGGAAKWSDSYTNALAGADVVVLPDNDAAGERHAEQVATALAGKARRIRILRLPGLPEKGRVGLAAAGGTANFSGWRRRRRIRRRTRWRWPPTSPSSAGSPT